MVNILLLLLSNIIETLGFLVDIDDVFILC